MKTVKLQDFGIGKYADTTAFPIGDLTIQLTNLPSYAGEYRYYAYMNGEKIAQRNISAEENVVEIEKALLKAGTFGSKIEIYNNGEKFKTLKIDNLLITEDENATLMADPEITKILQRISALEENAGKLSKTVSGNAANANSAIAVVKKDLTETKTALESSIAEVRKLVIGLYRFIYAAYNVIPYFNGGNFAKFAKECGIDTAVLSADEITTITGVSTNEQN